MPRALTLVAPMILVLVGGLPLGRLSASSQRLPGLKRPTLGDAAKALGADAIFKKGPAITTSIKDAKYAAAHEAMADRKDLFSLPRTETGGFTLAAGAYGATIQSYCLHAGTHAPSKGDGYLYAPVKGPYEVYVMHVAQRSVDHPEMDQHDVQSLIWALIARTKISEMAAPMRRNAETLLTKKERDDLNGGALGLLADDRFSKAFGGQPPLLRQVYEAEARLRSALTSDSANYDELERIAVLAGDPAQRGPGSREVKPGEWSLHPIGFWVRYFPSGYSTTRIEIDVPRDSVAVGKEFDPATEVAAPGDTARQRLLQSGRRKE